MKTKCVFVSSFFALAAAMALPAMAMNHNLLAPYAKCPAYFNGGLIDPVSPAYSTYSAYLRWGGADKTFTAVAGHGHDWWAAFDRAAYRWLEDRLCGLGILRRPRKSLYSQGFWNCVGTSPSR